MKFDVLKPLAWFFLTGSLVLLIVTPAILGISDELIRSSFSVTAALIIATLLLIFFYARGKISFIKSPISIVLFFVSLILISSSIFSISIQQSLFGFGMEVGTVISFIVLFLFYIASRKFFSNMDAIDGFYSVLRTSLIILTPIVLFTTLFDTSILIFDIFDFSVFSGLIFLMSVAYFEFKNRGIYALSLIGLSYFGILLDNDRSIQIAVFVGILIIIGSKFFLLKKSKERIGIPYLALIALIFIGTLFFFSPQPIIDSSQFKEPKPSFETTRIIVSDTIMDSPLRAIVGVGPNTFSYAWSLHKPRLINDTPVWDVNFRNGSSGIATLFVTIGLLGGLAFVALIGIVFYVGMLGLIRNFEGDGSRNFYFICTAFVASVYGLLMYFLQVQSISNLVLTFIFLGILTTVTTLQNPKSIFLPKLARIIITVVFSIILIASALFMFVKVYYVISFERGAVSFNETGDMNEALNNIRCAPKYIEHPACNRFLSELLRNNLQNIFSEDGGVVPSVEQVSKLSSLMMMNAQRAVEADEVDYRNWVALGNAYTQFALIGIKDGYADAVRSYDRATELSPVNPFLLLLKARLAYYLGENIDEARQLVQKSISLKPDYEPSLKFLNEINK